MILATKIISAEEYVEIVSGIGREFNGRNDYGDMLNVFRKEGFFKPELHWMFEKNLLENAEKSSTAYIGVKFRDYRQEAPIMLLCEVPVYSDYKKISEITGVSQKTLKKYFSLTGRNHSKKSDLTLVSFQKPF